MSLIHAVTGNYFVRSLVNQSFHAWSRYRMGSLASASPVDVQKAVLRRLVKKARNTRFGTDHQFNSIRNVSDFQIGRAHV